MTSSTQDELQKHLRNTLQTAQNISHELPKFAGVKNTSTLLTFAKRFLPPTSTSTSTSKVTPHKDLYTFFYDTLVPNFQCLSSERLRAQVLSLLRELVDLLRKVLFAYPANDGVMEALEFVKREEHAGIETVVREVELWEGKFEVVVKTVEEDLGVASGRDGTVGGMKS